MTARLVSGTSSTQRSGINSSYFFHAKRPKAGSALPSWVVASTEGTMASDDTLAACDCVRSADPGMFVPDGRLLVHP